MTSAQTSSEKSLSSAHNGVSYYPAWFPINQHLALYQRRENMSIKHCFLSAFQKNSEIANIWSHLIAFFIFILFYWRILSDSPHTESAIVMSFYFIPVCICFFMSSFFHTFYCCSERSFKACLALDMLGIVLATFGNYVPWIYYAFYCEKIWKIVYLSIVVVQSLIISWIISREHLLCLEKCPKRTKMISVLFVISIIILAHLIYRDGFSAVYDRGYYWYFGILLFDFLGVLVYLNRIPECFFSGAYDHPIFSHAIFHILVAIACWCGLNLAISVRQQHQLPDTCNQISLGENHF